MRRHPHIPTRSTADDPLASAVLAIIIVMAAALIGLVLQ